MIFWGKSKKSGVSKKLYVIFTLQTTLNMKNYLITSLFLCFHLIASSQTNAEKYFSNIDKAEIAIIDSQYVQSLAFYDAAFSTFSPIIARDYLNASIISQKIDKNERTLFYAQQLSAIGCELSFFTSSSKYIPFMKSKYWDQFIKSYPKIRKKFIKKNDWDLR
jgi:hypothetical protein